MNDAENSLLQDELRAFSAHDWGKDGEFSFASLFLTIKRNGAGQWSILHGPAVEVIVDSSLIPENVFVPVSRYDHFLQVRKDGFIRLFLFVPCKSSLKEIDGVTGALIEAEGFSRIFINRKKVSGIEGLNFRIDPSEFVGIYGESGIGKSVLINSILGTIREGNVEGHLFVENDHGERLPQDAISYLPQTVDIPGHLLCIEILQAAMIDRSTDGVCDMAEIRGALSRCSLDESILYKSYRQISEGQKRRLCIASVLLKKHSELLIADEPTTGLDAYSEEQVMETLRSISRSGITVLVVTHSVISAPVMDRVLVLKKEADGHGATICYDGPIDKDRLDIISDALRGVNDTGERRAPRKDDLFPSIPAQEECREAASSAGNALTSLRIIFRQGLQWFQNVFRIIFRDKKSVLIFGILALVCELTIQFGTNSYNGNNSENILFTLFTLAAPWLCAMYAAISVSELSRYYAWEHFSGLRSVSFLFGTVFAHAVPAFCIALIFTFGLFVSPRNCEIVKRWVCRGITEETSNETISRRLWFVKDVNSVPETELSADMTDDEKKAQAEERERKIGRIEEDRLDYIDNCRVYASGEVAVSQWYTPLKRGDSEGLDKAVSYSPVMTLYHNLTGGNRDNNYPLAKGKARNVPGSTAYVFCVVLLLMWGMSWIGGIIGITSAVILGNAKNAAVSIIVVFIFYILFSRIFITDPDAVSYLQPLAEIPANKSTIEFQDMGVVIPICCSFLCLGRYTSNLLAYAFTDASLCCDVLALCGMVLFCLLLSFVVLTKKKISK